MKYAAAVAATFMLGGCASSYPAGSAPSGWAGYNQLRADTADLMTGEILYFTDRAPRGGGYGGLWRLHVRRERRASRLLS